MSAGDALTSCCNELGCWGGRCGSTCKQAVAVPWLPGCLSGSTNGRQQDAGRQVSDASNYSVPHFAPQSAADKLEQLFACVCSRWHGAGFTLVAGNSYRRSCSQAFAGKGPKGVLCLQHLVWPKSKPPSARSHRVGRCHLPLMPLQESSPPTSTTPRFSFPTSVMNPVTVSAAQHAMKKRTNVAAVATLSLLNR